MNFDLHIRAVDQQEVQSRESCYSLFAVWQSTVRIRFFNKMCELPVQPVTKVAHVLTGSSQPASLEGAVIVTE